MIILKAEEGKDNTTFINKKYRGIQVDAKIRTAFNSETWVVPVKAGDIYIFPSETFHEVEATISDKVRYSLAFNTYFKGTIGSRRLLTRLTIE
jgi:predicted 2-oxoglutarate/Fe(II)-dependent dioxygenase YbiX